MISLQVNAMRIWLLSLSLVLGSVNAVGQDIAQQQMMINQQIVQQNVQNQINQNIQLANQQSMQAAANSGLGCDQCAAAAAPQASIAPGSYGTAIIIRLKSRTRRAELFYTTDGWTPTRDSILYTGPITISSTQTLEVVAIAPGYARSAVRTLTYTLPSVAAALPLAAAPASGVLGQDGQAGRDEQAGRIELDGRAGSAVLPEGMAVPLRFTAALDSSDAYVGEPIELALTEDLVVDGRVIAPAGAKAEARVIAVDPAGRQSAPGILSFAVQSIEIAGGKVPLRGIRTREGKDETKRQLLTMIPVAGPLTLLHHGASAHIDAGAELVATVAAPTMLSASIQ